MFVVAIPSYRRPDILGTRTLKLLMSWKVPMDQVYIFCVAEEEHAYLEMRAATFPEEVAKPHVVTGPLGLHHMRNHIQAYFAAGVPVLHMDDDIKDLFIMIEDPSVLDLQKSTRYKLHSLEPSAAFTWVTECFELARKHGARLWGIYPVRNGFFMKDLPEVTTDLRFCVGTFWGIWNDPTFETLHVEEKEDFERTLLVYEHDQCVLRFNRVCAATHYYSTPGGMQARGSDRVEESRKSCAYLLQRWPQYCRLYKGKKNRMHEVRLQDRTTLE